MVFDKSGNLYIGGNFTTIGGINANHIAKWNGTNWSSLGSGITGGPIFLNPIGTLAFDHLGNLYVGGNFTNAGGISANGIAEWNGSSWSALGSGVTLSTEVTSIQFDTNGNLYAGGSFTKAGGISANGVAKWNGTTWSALGSGVSGGFGEVLNLRFDGNGNLYAGGNFTTAGGISASNIAEWNGNAWSSLGSGVSGGSVNALALDPSGNLFVGGSFTSAGGAGAFCIAEWNGAIWSPLGSGVFMGNNLFGATAVTSLIFDDLGQLYVGGNFTTAGSLNGVGVVNPYFVKALVATFLPFYSFSANNNNVTTITGYTGPGGDLTIPGLPVSIIGLGAFQNNSKLTSVTIPGTLTTIGPSAFESCFNLTNVTFVNGLANIGAAAFSGCTNLTSVTIPASVTNIGVAAFSGCSSLTAINVDPQNLFYSSINGILFNKNQTTLLQYPAGLAGPYSVPVGVTNIAANAFGLCNLLTVVLIPPTVSIIGANAFNQCASLTAITVDPQNSFYRSANGVLFDKNQTTLIQHPAALGGSYLIPDTVTTIEANAFIYSMSLTSVTIPASVTNIGPGAFQDCSALTSIYFQGNPPSANSSVFFGDPNATVYYLPGAIGGTNTFGGAPAVALNLQPQTTGANLGITGNQFAFNLTGPTNLTIVIQASTDLATWFPIQTNTLTNGLLNFTEPLQTNAPGRYYRFTPQ